MWSVLSFWSKVLRPLTELTFVVMWPLWPAVHRWVAWNFGRSGVVARNICSCPWPLNCLRSGRGEFRSDPVHQAGYGSVLWSCGHGSGLRRYSRDRAHLEAACGVALFGEPKKILEGRTESPNSWFGALRKCQEVRSEDGRIQFSSIGKVPCSVAPPIAPPVEIPVTQRDLGLHARTIRWS